jgi:type IV secretory pathway TrbD component
MSGMRGSLGVHVLALAACIGLDVPVLAQDNSGLVAGRWSAHLMADIVTHDVIEGFEAPVHRALTEPILLAGAPRAVAILNGTLSAAIGLGLRLWIAGLVLWAFGHMAAVWAAKRDPLFVEVVRRHVRYPAHLGS